MSHWESIPIEDLCIVTGGGTPTRSNPEFYGGEVPWVTPKDMKAWEIETAQVTLTRTGLQSSAAKLISANSILIVVRSGVLKHSLPIALNRVPVAINQDMKALSCDKRLDPRYCARFLQARSDVILRWVRATTADNFPIDKLKKFEIPLPPLAEQRRIAEILDKADALRARRRAALAQLDALNQSVFLDMFGDPGANPHRWPTVELGSLATKFSDGPFGSNLKTEHYCENGVRVIRLQNVGSGAFLDDDAVFISHEHFDRLRKHECGPGDIIIATLGDPNLRACVLPPSVGHALNKADCIQMRPERTRANSAFLSALLNLPSTLRLAQTLMHGQTRVRISMGQLRHLLVPVPPIDLQDEFARRSESTDRLKTAAQRSSSRLDALFASLQHRAFRGEL